MIAGMQVRLLLSGILLLGAVSGVLYVRALHAMVDSAVTARDAAEAAQARAEAAQLAIQRNAAANAALVAEQLARERAKQPVINEVIRNVYRDRIVTVPAECAPVVADVLQPLATALDGVRQLRALAADPP